MQNSFKLGYGRWQMAYRFETTIFAQIQRLHKRVNNRQILSNDDLGKKKREKSTFLIDESAKDGALFNGVWGCSLPLYHSTCKMDILMVRYVWKRWGTNLSVYMWVTFKGFNVSSVSLYFGIYELAAFFGLS